MQNFNKTYKYMSQKYLDLAGLNAYDGKIKEWFKAGVVDIIDDAIRELFVTPHPADNEIWYTSNDENVVNPYAADEFGANIVINTYKDGKGVITFDGPVTGIGVDAFRYCSSLTSITIPNSVTSIRDLAFYNCSSLTSITIPNSVTSIGERTFVSCSSLTSITIPNSVTSIGESTFSYCSSLTSVTIPDSVTSIGYEAFENCSSLASITIPNSVTIIGTDAFDGCSSLTKVHISDIAAWCGIDFKNLDANPLRYTKNLFLNGELVTNLVIPNSVTSIGYGAFAGCSSLTSITIPNSVTSIGESTFSDCSSLTSITIPESVTSIGDYAFYNCIFLKDNFVNNSTLDAEANNYWGATIGDTEIDGLLIRNDTVIYCREYVTSVTIPDSVTSIGKRAFANCSSLTSVTIPNSVTSIEAHAFRDCSSLTSITFQGTKEEWSVVSKKTRWNYNVPAAYVQCFDGQVEL